MLWRMSLTVAMVSSACLLAGCGGSPEPKKDNPAPAPSATPDRANVTLHVADMAGRQGIT
jgi:hypothetical protein